MSSQGDDLSEKVATIKSTITTYPDFPKKGILFYDIMPILQNPDVFQSTLDVLSAKLNSFGPIDVIVALESRGFLFGPTLALQHKLPFITIRKKGKLPGPTQKLSYKLEYGEDTIEIQEGSIKNGSKAVIIDDLLATGGTLEASIKLIKNCGGEVVCSMVIIELADLHGKDKVDSPFYSILRV
ncbi:adenine phosphoribosyltransferase [Tetranychus urticae]|uniref:Adenine phosphoribosyltransferase n=1 Tax=Tetranychus urticae TaxID=32264 RepID=T1KMZ8_TETUR|nr:adenine phosphoribosyltransferase [Tetranychus urticae]